MVRLVGAVTRSLDELQLAVLDALAGMQPAWTLFGAVALIGFYAGHRSTRDLDLAFRSYRQLDDIPREVEARLVSHGFDVQRVQTTPTFVRLLVRRGGSTIDVDLVADPTTPVEPPREVRPGVLVDTLRELLAQKLCALLSRTELRDLEDVGAILDHGGDLVRGLEDAGAKDGGFSAPVLAWLLSNFPVRRAADEGRDQTELEAIRDRLIAALRV